MDQQQGQQTFAGGGPSQTPGKRKSHAPPQFFILLWHHFRWYRRHWIKLIITILIPFPLLGLSYYLVTNFTLVPVGMEPPDLDGGDFQPAHLDGLVENVRSPLSAGPFQAVVDGLCVQRDHCGEGSRCSQTPIQRLMNWKPPLYPSTTNGNSNEKHVDLNDLGFNCYNGLGSREGGPSFLPPRGSPYPLANPKCPICLSLAQQTKGFNNQFETNPVCVMLRHNIAYYPKSSKVAQAVMDKVVERMEQYRRYFTTVPAFNVTAYSSNPFDTIYTSHKAFKHCGLPGTPRILGFDTQKDLIAYTKNVSNYGLSNETQFVTVIPNFWGAVSFEGSGSSVDDGDIEYTLITDKQWGQGFVSKQLTWLQDILDDAIYRMKSGVSLDEAAASSSSGSGQQGRMTWNSRQITKGCTTVLASKVYTLMYYIIPLVAIISFIMSPINFLDQVLTEKELKLREYLYIMGVGSFQLKASWIFFYCLFLIPMSIAFAVFLYFFPGNAFGRTDFIIVMITVLLYNIAILAFCYMIAGFLQTPKRTSILLVFIILFFWVIAAFSFRDSNISGTKIYLARVFSLVAVTPMTIAVAYITSWESVYLGADWSTFFASPALLDEYGGLFECWCWFIGDTLLYLIVAWYFEHAFPGEFGVRYPPWFPFMPSFWFPKAFEKKYALGAPPEAADVEEVDNGAKPGISLINLTKQYTADKIGVNQLNLNFYQQEVTAFLGQNGAGKSTTMNTLVGLISPSSGNAQVLGMEIHNQMDDIRRKIGFVPQYDILYPSMTVEEHLQFYGWLKGMSKKEIKQFTGPLLERMDLTHLKGNETTTLSGGQKRKLSLLTAYMGNPQIIILDEPTSGVDPFSRRTIWELILSRRREATTILSTHFMDEADLLGDRVAIISNGELRAAGTGMYLKNRYGKGFKIITAMHPQNGRKENVMDFFRANMPSSRLVDQKGSDLTFAVPIATARTDKMITFLKALDKNQQALNIVSYGLSEPTMEEVFFSSSDANFTKRNDMDEEDGLAMSMPSNGFRENGDGLQLLDEQGDGTGMRATSDQIQFNKRDQGSLSLYASQMYAVFIKKFMFTFLSPSAYVLQIVMPLTFIVLLLLLNGNVTSSSLPQTMNIWTDYRTNILFFQGGSNTLATSLVKVSVKDGFAPKCSTSSCGGSGPDAPSTMVLDPSKVVLTGECPGHDKCMKRSLFAPLYCTSAKATDQANAKNPSKDIVYRIGTATDLDLWTLKVNESGRSPVGGFQFNAYSRTALNEMIERFRNVTFDQYPYAVNPTNNTGGTNQSRAWNEWINSTLMNHIPLDYAVVYHVENMKNGMENVWGNLLAKYLKSTGDVPSSANWKGSISTSYQQLKMTSDSHNIYAQVAQAIPPMLSFIFVALCFAFGTFGIASLVQAESAKGLKRMQMLFGCKPPVYWFVTFLCDLLLYMITVAVVMTVLAIFKNGFSDRLGQVAGVVIPYGVMAISFTYLLSFLFRGLMYDSFAFGTKGIVIFTVVSFIVLLLVTVVLSGLNLSQTICESLPSSPGQSRECKFAWPTYALAVTRVLPNVFLVDGLFLISAASVFSDFQEAKSFNPYNDLWTMEFLGQRIVTAIVASIVYMAIVVILEYFDLRINLCGCCTSKPLPGRSALVFQDPDLEYETRKAHDPNNKDPLIVKDLNVTYSGSPMAAVAGISFSVPQSECFGLLGINGAGKSTTFKVLTGFQQPSAGQAFLDGKDIVNGYGWGRLQGSTYCPQENTLFDSLTVNQHLDIFARLRGIPGTYRRDIIDCLIREVGLTPHIGKRASQLSGGNQRKLQFAISLLDYSPVIFLDEPTTGMDPGARRQAWESMRRAVRRGCSVVLTSHSMEECEALCDRLVIMVAGAFHCIGSVQYLKNKFGNKYNFKLKIQPSVADPRGVMQQISAFIGEKYPSAKLLEEHTTQLHYEINADAIALWELFRDLNWCRTQFPIEDFTVSQVTLEHVFVEMARMQDIVMSGTQQPPGSVPMAQQQQQQPQQMFPQPQQPGAYQPPQQQQSGPYQPPQQQYYTQPIGPPRINEAYQPTNPVPTYGTAAGGGIPPQPSQYAAPPPTNSNSNNNTNGHLQEGYGNPQMVFQDEKF